MQLPNPQHGSHLLFRLIKTKLLTAIIWYLAAFTDLVHHLMHEKD
jgi:hypothetical protein